ncbi:MAG: hypothetical protein ACFFDH_19300 [Promethearchaeota archaeon]
MITILLDRIALHEYTSSVEFNTLQNSGTFSADLIDILVFLLVWFTCGLILAYWVRMDLKKRNLKSNFMTFLIVLTSFIGFAIYIVTNHGEITLLERNDNFSDIEERIKKEEDAEFHDEVEEINEEELEDIIETIIEVTEIRNS